MSKIYIVLVSWNNQEDLRILLPSLKRITYPKDKLSFVFVDNGSEDNSVKLIKDWLKDKPEIKFFKNQANTGFSFGHNQGIKYALDNGADYVMLLNCDTQVEPDFMDKIMEVFKTDDQVGVVQSLLLRFQDKTKIQSFGNALHYLGFGYSVRDGQTFNPPVSPFRKGRKPLFISPSQGESICSRLLTKEGGGGGGGEVREINYASFAAVTIKREVFKKIGFLDEMYVSYHEDSDFCLRARLQGYKILLQPQSIVYHNYTFPVGKQADKNKLRYFWMERNRFLILLKFYKLPTLLLIIPGFLFMEVGQVFFSLFNGFFRTRLKVYGWLIKNFKTVYKARSKIQRARKFGDKKLFTHMTGLIEFQSVDNPLLKYIGNPILNLYFKIIRRIIFW